MFNHKSMQGPCSTKFRLLDYIQQDRHRYLIQKSIYTYLNSKLSTDTSGCEISQGQHSPVHDPIRAEVNIHLECQVVENGPRFISRHHVRMERKSHASSEPGSCGVGSPRCRGTVDVLWIQFSHGLVP